MSGMLARLREFVEHDLLAAVGRDTELTVLGRQLVGPVRNLILHVHATVDVAWLAISHPCPLFAARVDENAKLIGIVAVSTYCSPSLVTPNRRHHVSHFSSGYPAPATRIA